MKAHINLIAYQNFIYPNSEEKGSVYYRSYNLEY